MNNFVQKDKTAAWEAIPEVNRRRSLTKLLHAAEETTALMSQSFQKTTEVEVNASDLGMQKGANDLKTVPIFLPGQTVDIESNVV